MPLLPKTKGMPSEVLRLLHGLTFAGRGGGEAAAEGGKGGLRQTAGQEGRAIAAAVWQLTNNGECECLYADDKYHMLPKAPAVEQENTGL